MMIPFNGTGIRNSVCNEYVSRTCIIFLLWKLHRGQFLAVFWNWDCLIAAYLTSIFSLTCVYRMYVRNDDITSLVKWRNEKPAISKIGISPSLIPFISLVANRTSATMKNTLIASVKLNYRNEQYIWYTNLIVQFKKKYYYYRSHDL